MFLVFQKPTMVSHTFKSCVY